MLELRRIARSSDAQAINQMMADFYTDTGVIALFANTVNAPNSGLSGFQKDVFNTCVKLTSDSVFLRKLIANPECLNEEERKKIAPLVATLDSSPSFLALRSASAEIRDIPALAPQLQAGVQEFVNNLTLRMPAPTATGNSAVDAALLKIYTIPVYRLHECFKSPTGRNSAK